MIVVAASAMDWPANAPMCAAEPRRQSGTRPKIKTRLAPDTESWAKAVSIMGSGFYFQTFGLARGRPWQLYRSQSLTPSAPEEGGGDGQKGEDEGHAQELGDAEQAKLGHATLEDGDHGGERDELRQQAGDGDGQGGRRQRDRDAPGHEEVAQEREEHEQLQRRRPLDQGQVAPGVLEHHGL